MANRKWVAVAFIGIALGVAAGLLVVVFDFTVYRNILLILIAVLVMLCLVLMYVAYKLGRLKGISNSRD